MQDFLGYTDPRYHCWQFIPMTLEESGDVANSFPAQMDLCNWKNFPEHQKGDLFCMLLNTVMVIIVVYTNSSTSDHVQSWATLAQW